MSVDLDRIAGEYPFVPKRLDVGGGVELSYLDEGPADAPAILFVHGNPTWSFYWRHLVKRFRGAYRCVAVDHVGCGLSDKPQAGYEYTLARRVADLTTVVDRLGLTDVTLAMHDWGGAIGMGYATAHPKNVRGLMIFNTAAFRSPAIPWRIAACRLPIVGAWAVRGLNAFVGAAVHLRMATRSKTLFADPAVRYGYLAPYDSWENRIGVSRFVDDIPMRPGHPSYATLAAIDERLSLFEKTPSLIVWGADDWCFHDRFYREWLKRLKNVQAHMVAGAGHWVIEDARETVIEMMSAFLAELPER